MKENREYWRWKEYTWQSGRDWRSAKRITAGVDVGSVSSKALVLADGEILAFSNLRTGYSSSGSARKVMDLAMEKTGLSLPDIKAIVGTGYGRINIPFATSMLTEISCHGRAAHHLNGAVRTILDMGGQDCKVIRCDEHGRIVNFLMNDKCAAGTGRGIEVIADLLGVPIEEVGPLSLDVNEEPEPLSSTCVIFAKSEVVGLQWRGWSKNQVLAAYCASVADRVSALIRRVGLVPEFAITGGIAKNVGVVRRIVQKLGVKATVLSLDPQLAGALGAALFAEDAVKE